MNDKDFKQSTDGLPQELERVYGKAWQTVATLDDLTAEDSRRHRENAVKLETPKGKLTIRHRQMRGVWQCFAGRSYITGASGDNPGQALEELCNQYDVAPGLGVVVHGCSEKATLTTRLSPESR